MRVSKYKLGWIGLRVERIGNATGWLKRNGWMKSYPAQLNNRNAFNWVRPCRTHQEFKEMSWHPLAKNGLAGLAFWITDAQWENNSGLTDKQWQERVTIEPK